MGTADNSSLHNGTWATADNSSLHNGTTTADNSRLHNGTTTTADVSRLHNGTTTTADNSSLHNGTTTTADNSSLHNGTTTTTADVSSLLDGTTTTADNSSLLDATEPHTGTNKGKSCHDTKEGERCYTAVMWAMKHGIVVHPEWYPGLHVGSSFAEFQAHMNYISHGGCSDPCDICYTSEPGEQCYEAVTWAMEYGISLYPEAYGNLTSGSTFEEFQRVLYFEGRDGCKWPCAGCHTAVPDETCYA